MRSEAVTIPVDAPARHDHVRRRPVPAEPVAGLDRRRHRKGLRLSMRPAVAISINSPGGSPVQSRLIYKRIRDLAAEKNKTVLVFVEDVAASGGYMIAVAGDEIIADPSSIVGSIGVVSASFGFTDLMKKIGVERRVHTAGKNKAVLDPFRPEKQGGRRAPEGAAARSPRDLHRHGQGAARRQAEGRSGPVHRPVLDRQEGPRARPGRCARRHARRC